jgi:uncharacterized protein YbaR (Trm112 family)
MNRKEIKFILNYLDNNREHLETSQHEFLATLKKQYNATGVLTKKQAEFLYDIKEHIPALVQDGAVYGSEQDKYKGQY